MGCRSTPLPFFSLTPSPLLLLTRLSGALTLPGNKLPVNPTCLRCHHVIYLWLNRDLSKREIHYKGCGEGQHLLLLSVEKSHLNGSVPIVLPVKLSRRDARGVFFSLPSFLLPEPLQ